MGIRRPKRPSQSIDMAPLIDVVFLLLIFFMLTSAFTAPSLPLELPKASGASFPDDRAVLVSVDATGTISVDGAPTPTDAFEAALFQISRSTGAALPIHFRGDRSMDYGLFVDLMDRARKAGFTKFQLVHDVRGEP